MQLRVVAALATLLVVGMTDTAAAYPQFQFTTDNSRCSTCHISPVGGGLLNEYGRDESADTISMGDSESLLGDPLFLNGALELPEWVQIGGDFRSVALLKDAPDEKPRTLFFPMQLDLYTNFQIKSVSIATTVGVRGSSRVSERDPFTQRIVSREHYVMWRPAGRGPYVRLGRFFPVYGLRLHDHTSYIRRRLDLHTLEEPYALSGGVVEDKWEAHATAYLPSKIFSAGAKRKGAAVYYERRIRDGTAMVGAQARVGFGSADARYLVGGVGKFWFEDMKLLLMSELDLGLQTIDGAGGTTPVQLAGYIGATYFVKPWLLIGSAVERYDNDLLLEKTARDSINLTVQWFPRSHVELMFMQKLEVQGDYSDPPTSITLLMFHYYL